MDAISKYKRIQKNSSNPSLVTNVSNDTPPEIIIQPNPQNGGCKKQIAVLLSITCTLLLLAVTLYFFNYIHQQEKDRFEGMKIDIDQMRRTTLDTTESFLNMSNDNDEIREDVLESTETYNANNAKSSHIDKIGSDDFFENQEMDWDSFVGAFRFYDEEVPLVDYEHLQEFMDLSDSYEEDTSDFNSDSDKLQDTTSLKK